MDQSEVRVTIPGYRDLTRVGAGGFSMVYRAYQEAFDRTVAVKVLTVELVDETAQRRFQRECRASGRLSNHPNIVTVLDSGFTDDGRPFITTEFMSHGSLADRLESTGPYPAEEVLDIGVKMCSALAAVHAAGILHRDIKPQNILVSDYGEAALADFGISAITVGPEASIGTSSLTPLHVAPEVLEGQPTSPASDVYSLGSSLYMLLAGRAPFQDEHEDALLPLMRRVVEDPVPDIDRPDVPPEIVELLRYSMAKQPFARYPTALSFGEAIQATQAHLGYAVTPLRKPGASTGEFPQQPTVEGGAAPTLPPPAVISGPPPPPPTTGPLTTGPPTGPPTGPAPDAPPPAAAPAERSSRKGLVISVAVLVLLAMLVAAGAVSRKKDEPASPDPGADTTTTTVRGWGANATTTRPSTPTKGNLGESGGTVPSWSPAPGTATTSGLRFDIDSAGLDATPPTPGGVLRIAVDAEPASWNPATARFFDGSYLVADAIYDPLTVIEADGPKPYLANGVDHNSAFDEWTISLRSGVTFHDGSALDAAAVKANFDARLADELMGRLLAPVQSATVVGSKVVVKMRQPWPAFPVALAGQSGLVAAPAFLHSPDATHPIGTGPFAFSSATSGTKISLIKNASYWQQGLPYLDGVDVSIIGSSTDRTAALKGGQVDLTYLTDPGTIEELSGTFAVFGAKTSSVTSVILNASSGPLADRRVRQALAAATDRNALVDAVFQGKGTAAASPFPTGSPWGSPSSPAQTFDQDRARALLADYGASDANPITIELLVGSSPRQAQTAQILQSQWSAVGVRTTITVKDDTITPVVDGSYQASLWTYDVPTDPDELYVWFHTDAAPGQFTYDLTRLHDPTVDRDLEQGRQSSDADQRTKAYLSLESGLETEAPAVWFAYLPTALVMSTKVVGWDAASVGGVRRGGTPWATAIGFK